MLSGVKFIPRDKLPDEDLHSLSKQRKESDRRRKKNKRKGKRSRNSSSDDELEKIKKGSGKKKWYSSEENSSSYTTESESESEPEEKKHMRQTKKKNDDDFSEDESGERSRKRSSIGKKEYTSEDYSSSATDGSEKVTHKKASRGHGSKKKRKEKESKDIAVDSIREKENVRKELGLEWMLRSESNKPVEKIEKLPEEAPIEETNKVNPKELNPYLKDDGTGYPEDSDGAKVGADQLLSSSLVGDGGASWRLKAMKRAQEQAAREGRRLGEVVEERWGSLGELTLSLASREAAPSRAHLRAIKSRKRGLTEENLPDFDDQTRRDSKRDYLKDVSIRHREMRAPRVRDSLSWGKEKSQSVAAEGAGIISAAASSLNKFSNDGSFMCEFLKEKVHNSDSSVHGNVVSEKVSPERNKTVESDAAVKDGMSSNQLAAKAMQLRLKGKHDEAENLLQEAKKMKADQDNQSHTIRTKTEASSSRYAKQNMHAKQKKEEDDADRHLAQKIMQNKQYKVSSQADDEYDYEYGPSRKGRKKQVGVDHKISQTNTHTKRILTQKERCFFCLENPNRPMHLVVSIANHTYLMLPQWQPVVPGHCCILPIQHESATRTVDDDVWTEIRNFKKCLIMMFAEQGKEVVFLETVMGLAQQRRHCMIECIPLPQDIAKEAPLYFKKAIDEAEDEWSQHNAKKLIDTSQKGLRNSIPKHFPYFHVEFGLNRGFVHVIDDEKQFNSNLGLNVIRGMLQLADEDMYRRRRSESKEGQKQAVASFSKEWEPFDWTKQLHQTS